MTERVAPSLAKSKSKLELKDPDPLPKHFEEPIRVSPINNDETLKIRLEGLVTDVNIDDEFSEIVKDVNSDG